MIIVIEKKGDTSVCGNNRGITLRSTASKPFQMILLKRLHDGMEGLLRIGHVLIKSIHYGLLFITVWNSTFRFLSTSLTLKLPSTPSEGILFGAV